MIEVQTRTKPALSGAECKSSSRDDAAKPDDVAGESDVAGLIPAETAGAFVARVLVQANRSMSWRGNMLIAGGIAVVCLTIAIVFAFFGLWLVIPFAGLEVIFVTACLYWTVRRLSRKEIITVNEQVITLEWGYNQPDVSVTLPRHWSRLNYQKPQSPFDVGDLSLSAYGKRYALGASLGRDEKKELYRELSAIL